ncbi:hypothetical protein [Ekhidna sp.]
MVISKESYLSLFQEYYNKVDEELIAILKGHLLIEKLLNQIIEEFVFHPEILPETRLSFYQKIHLARSISYSEQDNTMWKLVTAFNTLRNEYAHNLDSDAKEKKLEKLKQLYIVETKGSEFEKVWEEGNVIGIAYSMSMIIGFLTSFEKEVKSFKNFVNKHGNPRK